MDPFGRQFGNYRLIKLLGEGGFAKVYLGQHIHLGTQAAIKIVSEQLVQEKKQEFTNEARTLAQLIHPNIVRLLDFGIADNGVPFFVMDFAANGTLRKQHPYGTQVPLATIVSYVKQIANALQAAHNKKVIHRDIKPANMLIGPNKEVWLSDFGIAVMAQSTQSLITQDAVGSWSYCAPEQFDGKALPASDQYALGIVVYEWLSGWPPFRGNVQHLYHQHHKVSPPPLRTKVPKISPAVEQVVLRALEKDPRQRHPSIQHFALALEQATYPQPSPIPPILPKPTRLLGELGRDVLAAMLDQIDDRLKSGASISPMLIAQATDLIKDVSSYKHPIHPRYLKTEVINITQRYLEQLQQILTQQPDCIMSVADALTDMLDPNVENEVLAARNTTDPALARLTAIAVLAKAVYHTVEQGCLQKKCLEALNQNLRSCVYATEDQMPAPERLNVVQLYILTLSELAKESYNEQEIREWLRTFHGYLPHLEPIDPQGWIWRHLNMLSNTLNNL